jgi:hypothetical protein
MISLRETARKLRYFLDGVSGKERQITKKYLKEAEKRQRKQI